MYDKCSVRSNEAKAKVLGVETRKDSRELFCLKAFWTTERMTYESSPGGLFRFVAPSIHIATNPDRHRIDRLISIQ